MGGTYRKLSCYFSIIIIKKIARLKVTGSPYNTPKFTELRHDDVDPSE